MTSIEIISKIGSKLQALRNAQGLTQEELADRAGLTKGFISQIERGLTSISIESLILLLNALDEDITDFFSESDEENIVFKKKDRIVTNKNNLSRYEYLIPGAQNWSMDPVLIVLTPENSGLSENPHEGEEFGYVLDGCIDLKLDDKHYKAKKGECFYFDSNVKHSISCCGKKNAKILLIFSPISY